MVRAEGLEPSRTLRSNGFSYPSTAFAATHRFRDEVWGLDYPFTMPRIPFRFFRCCPSSLYTFPAVSGRAWLGITMLQGSPNLSSFTPPVSRWALKFCLSPLRLPIPPRPHDFKGSTNQRLTRSDHTSK